MRVGYLGLKSDSIFINLLEDEAEGESVPVSGFGNDVSVDSK